jgi:hypothetical protein
MLNFCIPIAEFLIVVVYIQIIEWEIVKSHRLCKSSILRFQNAVLYLKKNKSARFENIKAVTFKRYAHDLVVVSPRKVMDLRFSHIILTCNRRVWWPFVRLARPKRCVFAIWSPAGANLPFYGSRFASPADARSRRCSEIRFVVCRRVRFAIVGHDERIAIVARVKKTTSTSSLNMCIHLALRLLTFYFSNHENSISCNAHSRDALTPKYNKQLNFISAHTICKLKMAKVIRNLKFKKAD